MDGRGWLVPRIGREPRHRVPHALDRGLHQRLLQRVQRALGERREGPNLLDLVSEELDAERLPTGRREDVDDPASDGELPTLLDTVDPVVPGARERRRDPVDAGLVTDAQRERLRPLGRGRHPLGERDRRDADEPALREHVERTEPLTDEVWRRLEPGADGDASAREERDPRFGEEPRRALRRVARIGVLGERDEQRPSELRVQRGEQQRERRLRHACPHRERAGERHEAVARAQLVDERAERRLVGRLVHASGGTPAPRGSS